MHNHLKYFYIMLVCTAYHLSFSAPKTDNLSFFNYRYGEFNSFRSKSSLVFLTFSANILYFQPIKTATVLGSQRQILFSDAKMIVRTTLLRVQNREMCNVFSVRFFALLLQFTNSLLFEYIFYIYF